MKKTDIGQLPTLMDILNIFWEEERNIEELVEKDPKFMGIYPKRCHKRFFQPIEMEDGTDILMPLSPRQYVFYRGENKYHEKCYPSLYRDGMTESAVFVERLKRCELELMLKEYPITSLFANSIYTKTPDGKDFFFNFRIGYDGLSQHYGIKTEFMDISLDPLVAAFFAASEYDSRTDTYHPIVDTKRYDYGVFYVCTQLHFVGDHNSRLDVVGMQPLFRPGRQKAFVYRLEKGENFSDKARKIFFRHDPMVNKLIFQLANVNKRLFPDELLNEKIRNGIVKSREFTNAAHVMAKERYYLDKSEKILKSYIKDEHIKISKTKKKWFTDKEKMQVSEYWKSYQKELFSKIILRWAYNGEVEEVDNVRELLNRKPFI